MAHRSPEDLGPPKDLEPRDEPPLRGPWPIWALVGLILGAYAVQSATLDMDTAVRLYGLQPAELFRGRWPPLVSDLFIHGGWAHAGMNALAALAFGAPAARFLGLKARGVGLFFVFYILCGVFSNLGYALLHPASLTPLAGASGAVSGLFGAAARLIDTPWALAPLRSRRVVMTSLAWAIVNAALGILGIAPGLGEVQVAWEAHIAGYLAGLLLIGPLAALARPARPSWPRH